MSILKEGCKTPFAFRKLFATSQMVGEDDFLTNYIFMEGIPFAPSYQKAVATMQLQLKEVYVDLVICKWRQLRS